MPAPSDAFTGDLGLLSVFEVGQMLALNGATGCLTLTQDGKKGYLYFDRGKLVNAVDDAYAEGENAAYGLFMRKHGRFEFRAEPIAGSPTITIGIDALMLEAARRLDEANAQSGAPQGPGETDKLQERSAALDALRDVFRRVAGEARRSGGADGLALTVHLYELQQPDDRLLYRPGRAPRMRVRGSWAEVPEGVLAASDYAELRARLIDASEADEASEGHPTSRRLALADGRALALSFIGHDADEALWLKPIGLPAPDLARLHGDRVALREALGEPEALVLVGGSTTLIARRLLHAVAPLAVLPGDTVLGASDDRTYAWPEAAGAMVCADSETLRARLADTEPTLVILDPALRADAFALGQLAVAGRVLAGVVGADGRSLLARWLARVAHGERESAAGAIAASPVVIVTAVEATSADGNIGFEVRSLAPEERLAALRGDVESLSWRRAA